MGFFFVYILKSGVCLSLFYLFYRLLLSKETFYRFNRIALLGILVFSLLLPLIEVTKAPQNEINQAQKIKQPQTTSQSRILIEFIVTSDKRI